MVHERKMTYAKEYGDQRRKEAKAFDVEKLQGDQGDRQCEDHACTRELLVL